jgi:hypothetical protein
MPERAFLHLTHGAWRQIRKTWNPAWRPALAWHSWISGGLVSATRWLQDHSVGVERAQCDLRGCIFILGYWRSGTTLLHELLSLDSRFAFPTTYACMNAHHFLMTQPAKMQAVVRPMDDMTVSNASPQEDEFALLCLGARSPYEALLVPRALPQALMLGDPGDLPPDEAASWKRIFLDFLRGVSLAGRGRPLIVKSPTHGYRAAIIRELMPDAKFVLLVRDPYVVFESTVRMWRTMMASYAVAGTIEENQIREAVCADRPRYEEKLAAGLEGLAPGQLVQLRYEDLAADPVATIAMLYATLGLGGFEAVRPALEAAAAARASFTARNQQPSVEWRRRLEERWAGLLQRYGY